jgi:hypothetical protein
MMIPPDPNPIGSIITIFGGLVCVGDRVTVAQAPDYIFYVVQGATMRLPAGFGDFMVLHRQSRHTYIDGSRRVTIPARFLVCGMRREPVDGALCGTVILSFSSRWLHDAKIARQRKIAEEVRARKATGASHV